MKEPNKLMIYLLQKVFKFECKACTRYWSYDEFQTHKLKGNCKKDPSANNYVSQLALEQNLTSSQVVVNNQQPFTFGGY